jgi:hypothetical protein
MVVHFKYVGETVMKSFLRRIQAQAIAALVMAIAVLATLVGLGLSSGIAGAASPNSHAQKVPLTTTNRNCNGSEAAPPGIGGGNRLRYYQQSCVRKTDRECGA